MGGIEDAGFSLAFSRGTQWKNPAVSDMPNSESNVFFLFCFPSDSFDVMLTLVCACVHIHCTKPVHTPSHFKPGGGGKRTVLPKR